MILYTPYVEIMSGKQIEQSIDLKFLVKFVKSTTENFLLSTAVYKRCWRTSWPRVFEWHGRFRKRHNVNIVSIQVLATRRERVMKKRPALQENGSSILHRDNAPAHNMLYPKSNFRLKNWTPVLQHPLYTLQISLSVTIGSFRNWITRRRRHNSSRLKVKKQNRERY